MSVRRLTPAQADLLRAQPLTYEAVGATAGPTPEGYDGLSVRRVLDRTDFEEAAQALMGWQVQSRSGIGVRSSGPVEERAVVLLHLGIGPLGVRAPCRVVEVVNEPDRRGFAYGTLPGHPEQGEERFVLVRLEDGRLELRVDAFSRPGSRLTTLLGPLGRTGQRFMAGRYLHALDR